jgi:intracellular sulfur oxidation DsrE/DsrF family protein
MKAIAAYPKTCLLAFLGILLLAATPCAARDYPALEGVQSLKGVFDFRSGDPMNVFEHLQLVHDTYNDKDVRGTDGKPDFAVIFMDRSVTLLSKDRESFSEEDKKTLRAMDELLSTMAREGIVLEVCLVATDYFDVDDGMIVSEIARVPNGWVSSIGYQRKGYGLVPVY